MAEWELFRPHVKRNRQIYILSGVGTMSKEKNMDRKIREDNLKDIEDEMKRPLFPTPFTDLWKKDMVKNADPEDVREEVDSLPDGGLYNVSIRFENMTPEVVSWLIGSMNSYIHMAREIKIEPVERDGK